MIVRVLPVDKSNLVCVSKSHKTEYSYCSSILI